MIEQVTIQQIADALGIQKRPSSMRAKRGNWPYIEETTKGGRRRLYHFNTLPKEVQAAIVLRFPPLVEYSPPLQSNGERADATFRYDPVALWSAYDCATAKRRERAQEKHRLLMQVMALTGTGIKLRDAFARVAEAERVSANSMRNWYYGVNKRRGAREYERQDWLPALMDGYTGRTVRAECSPEAWDWLCGHYLNRKAPDFASSYRRLEEASAAHGWVIPSERTLLRWMETDISEATRVFLREGAEALRELYPSMERDKSVFAAGEAVSGDGLKFDKLWIDWGDEILNTTTAWVWQDIRSNYILAHRVAKTENTDLFRLATYDLTAICAPTLVQVDNTRVAANKAMTGQAQGRRRFKDRPNDPLGILLQLGMAPTFSSPDHEVTSPGSKPVERSFGIGGLHSEVATHPKFINRGYSKETSIPIDEFRAVLAEEVVRFNTREKRRTAVCRGVMSFKQAFDESFSRSAVRTLSEAQRRLLLMMPEVVKALSRNGEIALKAGAAGGRRHRYWNERLTEFRGDELVAYYDPENIGETVAVYTLDGRFIVDAERVASGAFNDTATGREHNKEKRRYLKAAKAAAKAASRMSDLERAELYPQTEAGEVPEPGVVRGAFDVKKRVVNGDIIDTTDEQREQHFARSVAMLRQVATKDRL
jgi:hypothetical protein